ncbi:VasL domain-containing protein [Serratia rhizosphaerae]|uniref:VasL domain-containing protein n=1 Tax=Serratia rhizosphaerae TaxID=2597702 RepID=UPI002DBD5695|nr:VasL domain-containing protein [Serratia rhizosphaerae]MEB6337967.1 type VI secretion system ImpA family N-terminal domain-containing protein [Serratia rhizosphaerae]
MHDVQPRPVKTGSDPRQIPDFIALREEMAKLTHPARPDVNWPQVEALSLSLFELNGVELQTGAWYTLARSHLGRINGLNEGLTILNALLSHQWAQLWPQPVHARVEIINGLFQRLQKLFRTFTLGHGDLPALMQAEGLLQSMNDILARQELKHACQTASLKQQINNALTRLENSALPNDTQPAVMLMPQALAAVPADEEASPVSRLVYVIHPEPEVNVQVVHETPPPPKRWPVFLAGACSALVTGAVVLAGWHYAHRTDETSVALSASVAALPQTLNNEQIQTLKAGQNQDPSHWLKQASSQLNALAALPPDWAYQYGQGLVSQANALWPWRSDVKQLESQWQQQLALNGISADSLNGWHEGMSKLQELTTQLNALDGHKGKYITVSELKSQVFTATQAFNKTIPVEEQLRLMSIRENPQMIPAAQKMQTELHLKQLITRYSAVTTSQ